MDLSESFNEPEVSDVILNFSTREPSTGDVEPIEPARSFHVHAVALYTSPYFKAMLQRWEGEERPCKRQCVQSALPASGAAPSRHKQIELVELVEEDQLEAAEMVLRCMYKGGELPAKAHGDSCCSGCTASRINTSFQLGAWSRLAAVCRRFSQSS